MGKTEQERRRYYRRKKRIIRFLGGECNNCGSTSDLEVDHIDSDMKEFDVTKCWSVSWEHLKEELKKCQLLCQKCHLAKTKLDNALKCLGEENGRSKLTPEKVKQARTLHRKTDLSYRDLAQIFGVTHQTIGSAIRGDTWAHIGP